MGADMRDRRHVSDASAGLLAALLMASDIGHRA
jgi:hypothetical protein